MFQLRLYRCVGLTAIMQLFNPTHSGQERVSVLTYWEIGWRTSVALTPRWTVSVLLCETGPRSGVRSHCAQATAATDGASVSVESASASTSLEHNVPRRHPARSQ